VDEITAKKASQYVLQVAALNPVLSNNNYLIPPKKLDTLFSFFMAVVTKPNNSPLMLN
jgi:hypothetical protein